MGRGQGDDASTPQGPPRRARPPSAGTPPFRFRGPHPNEEGESDEVFRLVEPVPIREYWVATSDPASEEFDRIDGPAVIRENGDQLWYRDGLKHRWDGPAEIGADGFEAYYVSGRLHRLGGPAIVNPKGRPLLPPGEQFWIDGHRYSESEHALLSRMTRDEHAEATERLDNQSLSAEEWESLRAELEREL